MVLVALKVTYLYYPIDSTTLLDSAIPMESIAKSLPYVIQRRLPQNHVIHPRCPRSS